jgi:hypothetical protein
MSEGKILIIVEQKPLDEILGMLKGINSVLTVGCDGCSGIYQVGGEKQADTLRMLLEMAKKLREKTDLKSKAITVLRQCDNQIVATTLRPIINDYDAIISLACGVGVQTLAEIFPNKMVFPANNTKFIGAQNRELGKHFELCKACGECILSETGGICPVTRCAKGLLNGPCGGMDNGKCEVGMWEKDCAWVLIYRKLSQFNRLDLFKKFRPPRDYRISQSPRELGGEVKKEEAKK